MDANVFRAKLYESFHSSGIEDSLRSQLRLQLIQFIRKKSGVDPTTTLPNTVLPDIWSQVANYIVVDLLQICKYNYSLSVFLPETNNSFANVDRDYILQILNSRNDICKNIVLLPKVPILVSLLKLLSSPKPEMVSIDVQTELYRETLDKKLKHVDSEFTTRNDTETQNRSIEERLIKFQREYEEKCRKEMEENVFLINHPNTQHSDQ